MHGKGRTKGESHGVGWAIKGACCVDMNCVYCNVMCLLFCNGVGTEMGGGFSL